MQCCVTSSSAAVAVTAVRSTHQRGTTRRAVPSSSVATTPKQFRHRAAARRASFVRCAAGDDDDAAESAAAGDSEDDADVDLASGVAHAKYIQNVAAIDNPPGELGALIAVLQAQGMTLVSPSDRKGLHPLCVPLAKAAEGDETVCLMVSASDSVTTQVVAADGIKLRLLAKTCKEYIHKALVEEEAAAEASGGERSTEVAKAAGTVGLELYMQGDYTTLGKEVAVYLTLRVGKFPDTMEALVQRHIDKEDEQSALITCDLYKGTFEGWGRPHWYLSQVYTDMGRHEEARDAARFAMTDCEWSTLGGPLEECLERCGWGGKSVEEVKEICESRRGPSAAQFDGPKSDKQIATEEASKLLDSVVAGERSVGEITQRLAECYMNSDRASLSKLVMSSMSLF